MSDQPRIIKLKHLGNGKARLTFSNGVVRELEWKRYAKPGTVLASLADPAYSSQARLILGGRIIEWPDGADWAAGVALRRGRKIAPPAAGSATTGRNKPQVQRGPSTARRPAPVKAAKRAGVRPAAAKR